MATATEELTLADECYARAVDAGFTKKELGSLKSILSKKSEVQILAGIAKLSKWDGRISGEKAVALLWSLTDLQIADLEWALKTADGWD